MILKTTNGSLPKLVLALAMVAALLFILQTLPALGQDVPDDAQRIVGEPQTTDAARDYTCTAGATGGCTVLYVNSSGASEEDAMDNCGALTCVTRIEFRW